MPESDEGIQPSRPPCSHAAPSACPPLHSQTSHFLSSDSPLVLGSFRVRSCVKTTLPERDFGVFFPFFSSFLQNEPNSHFSLTHSCQGVYAFFAWVRLVKTPFSLKDPCQSPYRGLPRACLYDPCSRPDSLIIRKIPYAYFGRFGRFGSFSFRDALECGGSTPPCRCGARPASRPCSRPTL
jgi:hypothetical protein